MPILLRYITIGIVSVLSILLVKCKKQKDEQIETCEEDRFKAKIKILSNDFTIDTKKIALLNHKMGDGFVTVTLWQGKYIFVGSFEAKDIQQSRLIRLKTKKLKFRLDLTGGCEYTLGLYLYPAQERKYFTKSNMSVVFEQPVDVTGRKEKAYIICYKEN